MRPRAWQCFLMGKICIVTLVKVYNKMKVSRTVFSDIHHTFGMCTVFILQNISSSLNGVQASRDTGRRHSLLRDPIAGSLLLLLLLRSPPSRRHFRFFHQNTEKRGKKALKE